MTNDVKPRRNNVDPREIGKEDLQLLLRPKLGEEVIVVKTMTSSLLPPGENFACSIFKVHAVIKRNNNEQEEELNLVAKMFPYAEEVRAIFDFAFFFKKEIFFYEKLMPTLKQLEKNFGAKDDETFDVTPKIFGTRFSLDPNAKEVDDTVVIVMENLKMLGYYTLNKTEGMDLEHSKLTIKSLARLHALGIACKHHQPEFFKTEVLEHAKVVPFREDNSKNGDIFDFMFNMLRKDPRIAVHEDRLKHLLAPEKKQMYFGYVAEEPWLSIVHLDFWTNNILFHKNSQGIPDSVKFIDFQNYSYNSPLRDLPYFLCTSTTHEVMTRHFNELLDLYYDTFIQVLIKMKCDVKPFDREAFNNQLKIDATLEFFHNILAIKFFCAEIDTETYDPSQVESIVIFSDLNKMGYDKWNQIVLTYIEQNWI